MKEKVHFALAFSDILCSFSGLASVLGRRISIYCESVSVF